MASSHEQPRGGANKPPQEPESDMRTSQEQAEAIDRQMSLRSQLRSMFSKVVEEPVPDNLLDLLDDLEKKDKRG
jgi:hypothetical protein